MEFEISYRLSKFLFAIGVSLASVIIFAAFLAALIWLTGGKNKGDDK